MTINTDAGTVLPTLATVSQLQKRYPTITDGIDPIILQQTLEEATATLEGRSGRRLAPFVGHVYQDRLTGIDPDEYGEDASMPMSFAGSLGLSRANSLGADSLARHIWLDHFAPAYPELWTYNIQSLMIYQTYGSATAVDYANGGILGPDSTDGHIWLRMGTFGPIGSRFQVIYDGGYTKGIPTDLRRACLLQALKFLILDVEPQSRHEMTLDELDMQISMLIGPWVRG